MLVQAPSAGGRRGHRVDFGSQIVDLQRREDARRGRDAQILQKRYEIRADASGMLEIEVEVVDLAAIQSQDVERRQQVAVVVASVGYRRRQRQGPVPWSKGGDTSFENNAPLCRHDHVGRHKAGWEYIRLPDGRHQWISSLGHTYTTGAVYGGPLTAIRLPDEKIFQI